MSDNLPAPKTEVILYSTDDGRSKVDIKIHGDTGWLTQKEMAELFQVTPSNINQHLKNIFEEGELSQNSVIKDFLITATDGKNYKTKHYSLDVILAVGYRVKSPRGVEFRQWATTTLREYLVKGFVMNDERLKEPAWDYFDELLERIRDIRASEKRFYQKVRDLFALSQDYKDDPTAAHNFFAEVQNKLLHAVTGQTAAELVVERADPNKPNMNLTTWKGEVVRKADVIIAKNYLVEDEVTELNRFVTMFLDYAEDRVSQRKYLTLTDWKGNVDRFITFNERPLLEGRGSMSRKAMVTIAHERFSEFDQKRKAQQAIEADAEDLKALEEVEKQVSRKKGE
ncbi:MAG: virulence RhuM family protein [Desulfomicrobium sp.]